MSKPKCRIEALLEAIEYVGGMKHLANTVEVSYQTVLNWKSHRSPMSPLHAIKIEKVTNGKVNRKYILPDYPWEEFNS